MTTKHKARKLVIKPKRVRKVDDHHVIDAEVEVHGANGLPDEIAAPHLEPLELEVAEGPALVPVEKKGFWATLFG